jgi:2-oxoglutarate dehydrogenase complex dehydrogenase (E1) component-like enzyme
MSVGVRAASEGAVKELSWRRAKIERRVHAKKHDRENKRTILEDITYAKPIEVTVKTKFKACRGKVLEKFRRQMKMRP